ncbi:hypothetical protein NP233_g1204 [Leucocoprinus birnbaumii]|uniref:Uncharacterized protein n=1 Tax=Leucocoprinus birnbaumii TaxID=56174 RepID=A0AAD5W3D3_9AGAR|nr:hypothetical protein NP233_g1204 [Leucocoprinus birnbaumii]
MLGVCTRGTGTLRLQVLSASPALCRCAQVGLASVRIRTLVTLPPRKAGISVTPHSSSTLSKLSRPLTPLDFRIQVRNQISSGLQVRLNSTNDTKSSTIRDKATDVTKSPEAQSQQPRSSLLSNIFSKSPQGLSSFTKIVALAKPEKKPLLIAIGLLFISASVSMSIPFTIGRLIDFFSAANPEIPFGLSLWQASGALLLLFTAAGMANAGRAMLMRLSAQRIVARLRERLFAASIRQEVEFVEKGEGDVLSRLSVDSSLVGERFSLTKDLSDGLRAVVLSSVGLAAMFYTSPNLTLLMLAMVPPVSLGAVFYGRYLKKLSHQTQEAVGDMTKVATESLSALRTVHAFNALSQEEKKFSNQVGRVLELGRKEAIASGIFFGSTGWSGNVTVLGLLGYGGTLVSQGVITVGDLTSLLLYTAYVGNGLTALTSFFSSMMRAIGAGTRVFEVLDRKALVPLHDGVELSPDRRGTIKFEHVHFEYPTRKDVKVLKDFNLEIKVGETVAIVGESGGGKSSVHSLLLRYYDPNHGKVLFDGQDIRDFSATSWRRIIGVVPQDPVLFTGTIAENIAFGNADATREEIEDAAREANCEFIWGMPRGFDTPIGRLSLSGGQRQRLAFARALLKKPAILALDEATSALDATSERRVNDAIEKVLRSRQTTCIFVAHRLSTIARAERVVVMEGGRIVESGSYRELVAKEESRFRALMAAQLTAADPSAEAVSEEVQEEAEEVQDDGVKEVEIVEGTTKKE